MKPITASSLFVALVMAFCALAWWQFGGIQSEFGKLNLNVPDFNKATYSPESNLLLFNESAIVKRDFVSPDGNFSFEYPANYQSGQDLFLKDSLDKLKSSNVLLIAYKVSVPDLQPSYMIAMESDATTTEAAMERIKSAFIQQQCLVSDEIATSTNPMVLAVIGFKYECPGTMKGYEQWRANAALIKKEDGFYALTAVSTEKNWPAYQLEVKTMINSMAATTTISSATSTADQIDSPEEANINQ